MTTLKSLHSFHNEQFGNLHGFLDDDGNAWFVASDVCRALDLSNPRSSLALLDDDEKGVHTVDTLGGKQAMATVNEPGLYSLILRSRKPEAKKFKRWITHEVIPSIRKTGQYTNPQAEQNAGANIQIDEIILTYVSILRQMARMKVYPALMRAAFLAEAASLLSGYPPERFMPPAPCCCPFH